MQQPPLPTPTYRYGIAALLFSLALPATALGGDKNRVLGIDVDKTTRGRVVRIRTQSTPTFTVFRLSDPMRVVVDISGGDLGKLDSPITIEDGVLEQIATRQFSADGFFIARVIVGFAHEAAYDVHAEGNAVVVAAGADAATPVAQAAPPPVAPVDRAAAERADAARQEAEAAARRAASERQAADAATAVAKKQQEEATRVAREAERLAAEARTAKTLAEQARQEAAKSVERDRTAAQAALREAEARLATAESAAAKVAASRAEAERAAAKAEQARREAEQTAKAAEAQHKRRVAEIEERVALATKEKKSAEEAQARAARAKREAEEAQKAAEQARALAEKSRAETQDRLAEIRAREERLAADQRTLAAREASLRNRESEVRKEHERVLQAQREPDIVAPSAALVKTPSPAKPALASLGSERTESTERRLRLRTVKSSSRADVHTIQLGLDGAPGYEVQRLDDPPRLVIDLAATDRATRRATYELSGPLARRVRLGEHAGTLRAVVDLASGDVLHDVATEARAVIVALKTPPPAELQIDGTVAKPAKPAASAGATLADVRFERHGNVARIILELSADVPATVDDRSAKSWVLKLAGTTVPKALERSLDTAAYETVVRLLSTYQSSQTPPEVSVVASLAGAASQSVRKEGNRLVWDIVGQAPVPIAKSATSQTAGFATEAKVLAQSTPAQARGKRVNLRLKDADLVNVIRGIADITGENIIVAEDVKGKVTVNLRNVPWEQALDTILKSRGYDKVRQNNIIRIATSEQIQREKEVELAKKKAQIEVEDTVIRMISVNYAIAKEIVEQLRPILSARGSLQVDDRTNTIIAEDIRTNIDRIIDLTRRLDRQTPQVLIEARIVEASSNYEQELGIQWGGTGQATAGTGNPTGLVFPGDVIASGAADDPDTITTGTAAPGRYAVNLPAPIGSGAGGGIGFIFGSAGGSQLLNLRLSALERNGSGRIISSPRITTLDNRTAKIAQGVDIPISVVSAAGTNTRFIPANLELEVTPHVTNDGTVLLRIKTSKNEPDFGNRGAQGDPTIVKKYAETEVMVRDGDTSVIGGIYTRNTSDNYAEVPFFSKIPVLGWLFKKKRSEDRRAELLVFITPRIVNREAALAEAPPPAVEDSAPQ